MWTEQFGPLRPDVVEQRLRMLGKDDAQIDITRLAPRFGSSDFGRDLFKPRRDEGVIGRLQTHRVHTDRRLPARNLVEEGRWRGVHAHEIAGLYELPDSFRGDDNLIEGR